MTDPKFIYRFKWLLASTLIVEFIFWICFYLLKQLFSGSVNQDQLLFKNPEALKLIYLIIPIIGVYIFSIYKYNRNSKIAGKGGLKSLFKPVSTMSSFLKFFFFRNAFIFLLLALCQPIYGKKKVSGTTESLELVIALDISNSMNCKDISPEISRLEISKRALIQLVNNLHGEKIGVTLFANNAFVQLPLTRDYSAAKLFIQEIETEMISSQGTNIAEALEVSSQMFSKEITTKGIILVTDGENHERNADEILNEIKSKKIQLSVLGIGTKKGGLIPKDPNRPEIGYKSDAVGKTVITKLNESFLNSIAQKGGGKYSVSSDEFPNLSALLTQINQMKRTKIDTLEFDVKQERYQIPLVLSILCWLLFIFWSSNYQGILNFTKTND